jgi:hypothetical protein
MEVRTAHAKFADLINVKVLACLWMSFIAVFVISFFLAADNFHVMFQTKFSKLAKACLEVPADLLHFQFLFF